jgi:hypothetical protein
VANRIRRDTFHSTSDWNRLSPFFVFWLVTSNAVSFQVEAGFLEPPATTQELDVAKLQP